MNHFSTGVRVAAISATLLFGACADYESNDGDSPLESLATSLPEAASLSTGIAVGAGLTSGTNAAQAAIQQQADIIEMGRDVYCLFKAALDGSSVSLRSATIGGPYVGAQTRPALIVERSIPVGTGGLNCITITNTLYMRTAIIAWDGNGAVMPLPWSKGQVIASVHVIVQLSANETFDADSDIDDRVVFAFSSSLGSDVDVFPDAQATPDPISAGRYTAQIKPARLNDVLGNSGSVPATVNVQLDLSTTGRRLFLGSLAWSGSQVDRPLVVDIRVDGEGATGAMVKTDAGSGATLELFGPFFVDIAGAGRRAGFTLTGSDPTQLYEAFDVGGSVTHTSSNQNSYTIPTSFVGWPGDSSIWTSAFGLGRSTEFTTVLGGLPAVSTWFGS